MRQIREFRSSRGGDNFAACVADNCRKFLNATVSAHSSFGFFVFVAALFLFVYFRVGCTGLGLHVEGDALQISLGEAKVRG